MSTSDDAFYERLLRFVRGDLAPRDFESWMCEEPTAEEHLGAELYLEVISADYRAAEVVDRLRERLREHARSAWARPCGCIALSDRAVVPMGNDHGEVFRSIHRIKKRGQAYWWLWLGRCTVCDQWWLVAQEERQNDVFCMRRLDASEAARVVDDDRWPPDFDTYEALLRLGLEAGHRVSFVDPLGSSSLAWTIADLARSRPGIRVSEIARLLNLDPDLARTLAQRVVAETGLSIVVD